MFSIPNKTSKQIPNFNNLAKIPEPILKTNFSNNDTMRKYHEYFHFNKEQKAHEK